MKKRLMLSAMLAAMAVPTVALAQDGGANTGAIHFGADLNFATSYFFRGYNQEDTGLIFQPNVYAYTDFFSTADDSSALTNLRLKVGSWNSLHSEQTAGEDIWFESDLYALATATFAKTYYVTLGYTAYTYPNDAFETIQEVGVSAGVSDISNFWDKSTDKTFTLPFEIGAYKEFDDGNGEEDLYAEIKITPTLATSYEGIPGFGKATLSFPVILGGSLDGYYVDSEGHNDTFGYIQGGVAVSLPFSTNVIPAKYGSWSLNAGVNYIQMLSDSTEFTNDGGEDYEVQGIVGISMTY